MVMEPQRTELTIYQTQMCSPRKNASTPHRSGDLIGYSLPLAPPPYPVDGEYNLEDDFALPPTYEEAVRKPEVTGNISAARDEITSSPATPGNNNDVTPERVMNVRINRDNSSVCLSISNDADNTHISDIHRGKPTVT